MGEGGRGTVGDHCYASFHPSSTHAWNSCRPCFIDCRLRNEWQNLTGAKMGDIGSADSAGEREVLSGECPGKYKEGGSRSGCFSLCAAGFPALRMCDTTRVSLLWRGKLQRLISRCKIWRRRNNNKLVQVARVLPESDEQARRFTVSSWRFVQVFLLRFFCTADGLHGRSPRWLFVPWQQRTERLSCCHGRRLRLSAPQQLRLIQDCWKIVRKIEHLHHIVVVVLSIPCLRRDMGFRMAVSGCFVCSNGCQP